MELKYKSFSQPQVISPPLGLWTYGGRLFDGHRDGASLAFSDWAQESWCPPMLGTFSHKQQSAHPPRMPAELCWVALPRGCWENREDAGHYNRRCCCCCIYEEDFHLPPSLRGSTSNLAGLLDKGLSVRIILKYIPGAIFWQQYILLDHQRMCVHYDQNK